MNKCVKREKTTGHTGESAFLFCGYSNVRLLILGLHPSGNSDSQEGEPDVLSQPPSPVPRTRSLRESPRGALGGEELGIGGEGGSSQQKRTSFTSLHFSEERNEQFQPYYQISFF